jgi:hypothetical protein
MLVAKQVADFITWGRVGIACLLAWLGAFRGQEALPLVIWLMIADWAGDSVDGKLARRSRVQYHTWIGDHDLEVDVLISAGLLAYLLLAGFVNLVWVVIYLLVWAVIFWRWGYVRVLAMLIQAPIYGWFIWVALSRTPGSGIWIVIWIIAAIALTWPYFPKVMVPGFLAGMREVIKFRSRPRQ